MCWGCPDDGASLKVGQRVWVHWSLGEWKRARIVGFTSQGNVLVKFGRLGVRAEPPTAIGRNHA